MKLIFYILLFIPAFLGAQGKQLYILNRGGNNIVSVPLDNPDAVPEERYHGSILATYDMVLDSAARKLYWTTRFPEQIRVATIGSDTSALFTDQLGGAVDVEIDHLHQKLYWVDHMRGVISRANLDGTAIEDVTHNILPDLTGLALYPSQNLMFFSDLDSAAIWKSDLDGNNQVFIVNDPKSESYPVKLALDTIHHKLYWSDDGYNRIVRINLDGSEREIFYQGEVDELIYGLFLDLPNDHLYWTDYFTNRVGRATISTMEALPFVTMGLNDPLGVTIVNEVSNFQHLVQEGNTWIYAYNTYETGLPDPLVDQSFETMTFSGDTVINGLVYHKLLITADEPCGLFEEVEYLRADGNKVYRLSADHTEEYLMIDFDEEDSYQMLYKDMFDEIDTATVIIDSFGLEVTPDGTTVEVQYVKIINNFAFQDSTQYKVYKDIGFVQYGILFPYVGVGLCDVLIGLELRCYVSGGDTIHLTDLGCYESTLINSMKDLRKNSISLSPNPVFNRINIPEGFSFLDMVTINGQSVFVQQDEHSIWIDDDVAGLYIVRLISETDQKIYFARIVKM